MGCIYMATNKHNGKAYIGKTIFDLNKRKKEHIYDSSREQSRFHQYFHKAIAKYGADAFEWFELFESDNEAELIVKEQEYIQAYTGKVSLYNLTTGGEDISGFSFSSESRAKMSASQKKIRETKEWKERMSAATKKSLARDPEHTQRFREGTIRSLKEQWKDPAYIAWQKERSSGANNPAAVKIMCGETQEIFGCIKDAAIKYNRSDSSIREVLDKSNRTSASLHWQRIV